ncbi:MAG: hypothetical protein MOGMAGMI_02066 [Candidatus Omnitrophica bacterium]|nr:hypothetical protein [Candidatus Omnitrophota bacterium]
MSSESHKSKAIQNIEERMERLDPASFRYRTLEAARAFKTSWIELGQFLYTVYKDKLYREWQYLTFEAYCAKEVGIKQPTALKLLKSYQFLEHEEPEFLREENISERKPDRIPSFESVNALRLLKNRPEVSAKQYEDVRDDVLEEAKEDGEVKKKIRYILKTSSRKSPEEEKQDKKEQALKRLLAGLQTAKTEFDLYEYPAKVRKKIDELIEVLEDYRAP